MKFEFKMDVKGVPTASVACAFECSADELVTLISDPVYQKLGQKLVEEISFAPKAEDHASPATEELCSRVISILNGFQKHMEADSKRRDAQFNIMQKAVDRATKFAERTQKF